MEFTLARLEESVLPLVSKPNRYQSPFGNAGIPELRDAAIRICILIPAGFETALARPGLHTLLDALRSQGETIAGDRTVVDVVFAPAADFETELRRRKAPLFGLAAAAPLCRYDLLLAVPESPLDLPDLLVMLELGGVPLRSAARADGDPLVFLAGEPALSPGVALPFVDAYLAGDPEAFASDLARLAAELAGPDRAPRSEILANLGSIPGMGRAAISSNGDGPRPARVEARWLAEPPSLPAFPFTPLSETRASGMVMEMARCSGARDPLSPNHHRFRGAAAALGEAEIALAETGHGEVLLTFAAAGGHPDLVSLLESMNRRFEPFGVKIALEEVDPAAMTPALARELRKGRRTRLLFAPVAVSARLRELVGRPLSREAMIEAAQVAWRGGWSAIRFQVVLGLPGETEAGREEWLDTMEAIRGLRSSGAPAPRMSLDVVPFVPRPHTRWEREPSIDPDACSGIVDAWRRRLQRLKVKVAAGPPYAAVIEAALWRGDARLADAVEAVARAGGRRQADSEAFDVSAWKEAMAPAGAASGFESDQETAPWSHIVTDTPPQGGVVEPSLQRRDPAEAPGDGESNPGFGAPAWRVGRRPRRAGRGREGRQADRYRLRYSKTEPLRFTAHLDVTRAFERAFRRVQLPVAVTQGKDRRPKIAFGPPLPLGMTSAAEYLDLTLSREVPEQFVRVLNGVLPEGLAVVAAAPVRTEAESLNSSVQVADYDVSFTDTLIQDHMPGWSLDRLRSRLEQTLAAALEAKTIEVTKVRGEESRTFNARPSLLEARVVADDGGRPLITLRLTLNQADSVRPELLISTLCDWAGFDERLLRVHRGGLYIPGRNKLFDPLDVVASGFAWWRQPLRGGAVR
jgi:radical SAM-linked protein